VNDAANKAADQLAKATIDPRLISVDGEAERLWKHVLFGTGTCVGMLSGYTALELPGDPLPHLYSLAERLHEIIATHEKRKSNQ